MSPRLPPSCANASALDDQSRFAHFRTILLQVPASRKMLPFKRTAPGRVLDAVAVNGAVSVAVSAQGSTAYTDPNTLLEQHARRRRDKIYIESIDHRSRITFGEFQALTPR